MTPVIPKPARSFKLFNQVMPSINFSLLIVHPNEAEGKVPHLLLSPNLEEPSRRTLTNKL